MVLEPIKETYGVICNVASKVYEGLSLVFPAIPGWVAEQRAECLINATRKTQEKLDRCAIPKDHLRHCSLKLGIPWVENASLEDDETMQELWANLLANALNPHFKEEVRTAFLGIIKELSVLDARILNLFMTLADRRGYVILPIAYLEQYENDLKCRDVAQIKVSMENLTRLRLIDRTQSIKVPKVGHSGDLLVRSVYEDTFKLETVDALAPGHIRFTPLGLVFINTCVADAGNNSRETSN